MAYSRRNISIWWGIPKKFSERVDERKITWLELFYDLVYVAVISQLTFHLSNHLNWQTLGYSFFLFAMVFWSWMNGSLYHDLHGSDGIRTRLLTLWQMLAIAAVAITLKDTFEGQNQSFAVSFLIVQCILTYLYWSTGYYDPSHKELNKYYVRTYALSAVLFAASIFTTYRVSNILWLLALILNYGAGIFSHRRIREVMERRGDVFSASASIIERFGLFTIIVLGETILGVVSGISEIHHKTPVVWVSFITGILIAFLLWWTYFDLISDRKTKPGYNYFVAFSVLHIPLLGSFGVVGSAIKIILSEPAPELCAMAEWMFSGAIALILLSIVLISWIMEQDEEMMSFLRPVSRLLILTSVLMMLVPVMGYYVNGIAFLLIVMGLLFIPVYVGTVRWIKFKLYSVSAEEEGGK